MEKLIDHLLATEYDYTPDIGDEYTLPYSHTTDKPIMEAITELFESNTLDIHTWDVDGDTLFDSPSYTTGYVAAAWIEDEALHTYHVIWEIK